MKALSVQNREERKLEKSLKENSETKRKDRPDNKHFNANEKSHTKTNKRQTWGMNILARMISHIT